MTSVLACEFHMLFRKRAAGPATWSGLEAFPTRWDGLGDRSMEMAYLGLCHIVVQQFLVLGKKLIVVK
jgi:hypothetical protein